MDRECLSSEAGQEHPPFVRAQQEHLGDEGGPSLEAEGRLEGNEEA